jgi:hypothetical protein
MASSGPRFTLGTDTYFPASPGATVSVSALGAPDLGDSGNYYTPFNSFTRAFAGTDPVLQASLWSTFAAYATTTLHPACAQSPSSPLSIATYLKPYEYRQQEFLAWLRAGGTRQDFLSVKERGVNDHTGNLGCPLVADGTPLTPALLKQTNGMTASVGPSAIRLAVDNTYNPLRWTAPINEIHAHEQPSLYAVFSSTAQQVAQSGQVLQAFRAGDHSVRILLDYDVELEFSDLSAVMMEGSAADAYGSPVALATDLLGVTHRAVDTYTQPGASEGGHTLSTLEDAMINRYFSTRFLAPTFQLSVGVNLLQDGHKYRLQEFQLAGKNYASSILAPATPGAPGFKPTANDTINNYIAEGGNSGNVGWTRLRVDALALPAAANPEYNPVVAGGEYVEITGASATLHLTGTLDLTNYYVLSRGHQFFPGQRGYWNTAWVGFEGDDPAYVDANEHHAIYWMGLIFENHGPQRAAVKINRLNVRTQ